MGAADIISNVSASRRDAIILLVEDNAELARGMKRGLEAEGYVVPEIVSQAKDFDAALARVRPDLVLFDIVLGDDDGTELAERLAPHTPFLFVSAHADPTTVDRAVARQPRGFVVKPFATPQLVAAIEIALGHGGGRTRSGARVSLGSLSAREHDVLDRLLAHARPPAIARALFISQHTVRNHLRSIFTKLGVRSQQQLLDLFTRNR